MGWEGEVRMWIYKYFKIIVKNRKDKVEFLDFEEGINF